MYKKNQGRLPIHLDSPRQAFTAHSVSSAGAVGFLEAVEVGTVKAWFTLLRTLVLFEAASLAGHTIGILSIAEATFLQGLTEDIPPVREARGGRWGVRDYKKASMWTNKSRQ